MTSFVCHVFQDNREESVQKTASTIAENAYNLSFDPDYMSPFALSAIDAGIQLTGACTSALLVLPLLGTSAPMGRHDSC